MCIDKLTRLGFTEKESQVYLMLFRMGPSPVSAVAQRVSLKRVTVYAILDALFSRGLVTAVDTDQGRRYIPQDPSCLVEKLEEEKTVLDSKMKVALQCVEELESPFRGFGLEPKRVLFYEGQGSVEKALLEEFIGLTPLHGLISSSHDSEVKGVLSDLIRLRKEKGRLTMFHEVQAPLFSGGSLLVQEETVGFLTHRESLELMIIRDPFYAQYVTQVLLAPYFPTMPVTVSMKSVPAVISKGEPVKG